MEQLVVVQDFWALVLQACAAVIAIGGAVAVLVKLVQWLRKPVTDNADALDEHETYLANDNRRIEALERKQDEAGRQNKLMLRALVTLLGHEIDGNHTAQLISVRDEIQDYLIER